MGATMVAVGFLVFALTVMRGTRPELRLLLFWIRRAGLFVVVGTVIDGLGQVIFESGDGLSAVLDPAAYSEALSTSLGLALLLRLVGGGIVTVGARVSMVHAHSARDRLRGVSAALPIGAGSTRVADHPADYWDDHDVAWDLDRHGLPVALGFALLLVSHTLDGHTVTEGNRFLTGTASGLHVLAAAVWAGGVAALALIVRRRARRGEPTHALVMVTRYSIVATIALVAVALLGAFLAIVILDSPSELWTTDWGRFLMAKTAVVAVAVGLGAHNHHVVVPALEASEEDETAVARLRATLRNEVIVLVLVTGLTALLVRAASTLQ
ncbi:CopD family protein [Iamia majanohamensis]|uniref:CopD family protein n=1 Tax=Iamia majanohamensis TaxID=467976 RepID=A0AAF0BWG7_9ACTN|nr:CopD family protein [Iamia majanohamensis]WCO68033.1 CopD family protein [Iamia majanohamensis]